MIYNLQIGLQQKVRLNNHILSNFIIIKSFKGNVLYETNKEVFIRNGNLLPQVSESRDFELEQQFIAIFMTPISITKNGGVFENA